MYAVIPTDPTKYQWYHNNITEEEASFVLRKASGNCFLVRSSVDHFILSCQLGGYIHHFTVTHHSEDGYHLQDKEEHFQSIPDLVTYYRHTPPEQRQLLGTPCDREQSGKCTHLYRVEHLMHACGRGQTYTKIHGNLICPG